MKQGSVKQEEGGACGKMNLFLHRDKKNDLSWKGKKRMGNMRCDNMMSKAQGTIKCNLQGKAEFFSPRWR